MSHPSARVRRARRRVALAVQAKRLAEERLKRCQERVARLERLNAQQKGQGA